MLHPVNSLFAWLVADGIQTFWSVRRLGNSAINRYPFTAPHFNMSQSFMMTASANWNINLAKSRPDTRDAAARRRFANYIALYLAKNIRERVKSHFRTGTKETAQIKLGKERGSKGSKSSDNRWDLLCAHRMWWVVLTRSAMDKRERFYSGIMLQDILKF